MTPTNTAAAGRPAERGGAARPGWSSEALLDRWSSLPTHNWGWFALRGVLATLLGIATLLMPAAALFAFALVFAAFSLADGVVALISGVRGARRKEERWGTLILQGVLGIAVGAAFLFFPLLGTIVYAVVSIVLIAAWAVIIGALEIATAYRLRREIEGEWLMMLAGALSVLLGALLLVLLSWTPGATLLSFAWLIGGYALVVGILLLVLAFKLRRRRGAAPRWQADEGKYEIFEAPAKDRNPFFLLTLDR